LIIPFENHLRSSPNGIMITETNMRSTVDVAVGVFARQKRTNARMSGPQTINIQPSIPTKIPTESTAKLTGFVEFFILHHLAPIIVSHLRTGRLMPTRHSGALIPAIAPQ
jgi:hypothetical protein